jgi:TolB protein
VRNLTNAPGRDTQPTWSPDGQFIAFTSDRDGNSEIYLMAADGSNPRNISNDPAQDQSPNWSR